MRWRLIVIGIAGFVAFMGWQEYKLSQLADPTPTEISLSELAQGGTLANAHVNVGPHWRLYPSTVYTYEVPSGAGSDSAKPDYKVDFAYYPVISPDHPFFSSLYEKIGQYGSFEAIPDEDFPAVKNFSVLVKTRVFDTIGDIPDSWEESDGIQGTIINEIESVGSEDARLINQAFPEVNVDNLLVLEEGRKPMSSARGLGMMGGSGFVIALIIGLLIRGMAKRREQTL